MKVIKMLLIMMPTLYGCSQQTGDPAFEDDQVFKSNTNLNSNFNIGETCNVALDRGLKTRYDVLTEEERFAEYKSRLCSLKVDTYDSFKTSAAQVGLDIPLAEGLLGMSGSSDSKSKQFKQTYDQFCSSSYADEKYRSRFRQRLSEVNTALAKSWERCHELYLHTYLQLNQTGTFISIVPQDDFQNFTVEIERKDPKTGNTAINNISPPNVECFYGGSTKVSPGKFSVAMNNFSLNCKKAEYLATDFSLETQAGVSNHIKVPMNILKYQELDTKYREVLSSVEAANDRLSKLESKRLIFEKLCAARESNNCSPIVPNCSQGFKEAFTESNTWVGGRCGYGQVCRVCYKE